MKVELGLKYFTVSWLSNGKRDYQILPATSEHRAKKIIQAALPWAYAIKATEVDDSGK